MKRKRRVILIACSVALLALFVAIAWLKAKGDFYAMDRSGMMLSVGETASHLFSNDVENGLMLVSAEFPKQPNTVGISQLEALQLLNRSGSTWQTNLWAEIEGVGQVGIFTETESGEVVIYGDKGFVFGLLSEDQGQLKIRHFTDGVSLLFTQMMLLPQGFDFGEWEVRRDQSLKDLNDFYRCSSLESGFLVDEMAIFCSEFSERPEARNNGVLIYFAPTAQQWQAKNWNPKWPVSGWKGILVEEGENLLNQ